MFTKMPVTVSIGAVWSYLKAEMSVLSYARNTRNALNSPLNDDKRSDGKASGGRAQEQGNSSRRGVRRVEVDDHPDNVSRSKLLSMWEARPHGRGLFEGQGRVLQLPAAGPRGQGL